VKGEGCTVVNVGVTMGATMYTGVYFCIFFTRT